MTRTGVARALGRHHVPAQVYRAINRLIDTDFLREEGGRLALIDPVFALWLALEPARRAPRSATQDPRSRQRLLAWFEAQHAQGREAMGSLFERRVENLARQFRGQTVDGRLLGVTELVRVPMTQEARALRRRHDRGRSGGRPVPLTRAKRESHPARVRIHAHVRSRGSGEIWTGGMRQRSIRSNEDLAAHGRPVHVEQNTCR